MGPRRWKKRARAREKEGEKERENEREKEVMGVTGKALERGVHLGVGPLHHPAAPLPHKIK